MRKKGFTLVEMLAAVIIIGILAGLTMLASGSAADRANKTACIANKRTIMSAYDVYSAENNGESLDKFINDRYENMMDNEKTKCPSQGDYYAAVSTDGREHVCCTYHDGEPDLMRWESMIKKGTDSNGRMYYYISVNPGDLYNINGNQYLVVQSKKGGIIENYSDKKYLEIDYLSQFDNGIIKLDRSDVREYSKYTIRQKTFTKGTVIKYKGREYVAVKDISGQSNSASSLPGGTSSNWYPIP